MVSYQQRALQGLESCPAPSPAPAGNGAAFCQAALGSAPRWVVVLVMPYSSDVVLGSTANETTFSVPWQINVPVSIGMERSGKVK